MPLGKLCAHAGCGALVGPYERYCENHQKDRLTRYGAYDQSIRRGRDAEFHAFYVSSEWHALRSLALVRYNGLCVYSYFHGALVPAEEVHHIEPLKQRWDLRLSLDNLIPLSHAEHMRVEAAYKRGNEGLKSELRELLRLWREKFQGGGG